MNELKAYVDQKNRWNKIFNGEQFELNTAAGRQRVANSLDADMSPENLTCDGELSRTQVARRYRELTKAGAELHKLDPAVKIPEMMYW